MNKVGSKHLTLEDRNLIQNLLTKNLTCKEIAFEVGKDDRCISREIRDKRTYKENGRHGMNNHYGNPECKTLTRFPYVCNGCSKRSVCYQKDRYYYNAVSAQKQYESLLSDSRLGLDISSDDFDKYNTILAEGVAKNQSIHHIVSTTPDFPYSERSVYRHIDEQVVDIKAYDLRRKVKFKERKHYTPKEDNKKVREGRTYVDFIKKIGKEQPLSITEVDTVEGPREGKHKCLLTIHFTAAHFMLIYVLESKTSASVNSVFIRLQKDLGAELFSELFRITLTDRGTEFVDPSAIEIDQETGEKFCNLFYCNSYASYQKGAIEENHELIRCVIPKGIEFDSLTQDKANLLASHINSYHRESVDATPYELAEALFGEEMVKKLEISPVKPDLITLKPSLLK